MAHEQPVDAADDQELIERSPLAVFCDPRASALLLRETVRDVALSTGINEVVVDLESEASVAAAREALDLGLHLRVMRYEAAQHSVLPGAEDVLAVADDSFTIEPRQIAGLAARIMIVPAMLGNGHQPVDVLSPRSERTVDLGPTTRPGMVITALSEVGRSLMMVDPPERGLVSIPVDEETAEGLDERTRAEIVNGTLYRRRVIRFADEPSNIDLQVPGTQEQSSE